MEKESKAGELLNTLEKEVVELHEEINGLESVMSISLGSPPTTVSGAVVTERASEPTSQSPLTQRLESLSRGIDQARQKIRSLTQRAEL